MIEYCVNTKMLNNALSLIEKIKLSSVKGFRGIEPWYYEVEEFKNVKDLVKCCEDYNVQIPTLEVIQGFMEKDYKILNVVSESCILEECKRRFELADQINAKYIIITPPFSHRGFEVNWSTCLERYNELYEYCTANFKCIPTLEFMGQTKLINNYSICQKFLNELKTPNTKMIIDAYHIWRGGDAMNCFMSCNINNISLFHISDADKNIERQTHRDRDRVLPLDGQIDLHLFADTLKQIKFKGFISVGVYNPILEGMNSDLILSETKSNLDLLFR